ncbi:MAG TPA: shikimate kinase [Pirellulales bacterium]|nr:shikimate kinase [Pirellulales bacterium]
MNAIAKNIVLIGYRGTGKTTVARALAERLGWQWLDADVELETRAGCSIADMFATAGEAAFRDLESQLLAEFIERPKLVLATGGGVVLRDANRRLLEQAGMVVWLEADIDTLAQRVSADAATAGRRPNLTAHGGRLEIERLLAEREPLYRQCAGLTIHTPGRSPDEIAAAIAEQLAGLGWSAS